MRSDLIKASMILGAAVVVASIIIVVPICVMMSQITHTLSTMDYDLVQHSSGRTISIYAAGTDGLNIDPSQTWPFLIATKPQEPLKVEIVNPGKK